VSNVDGQNPNPDELTTPIEDASLEPLAADSMADLLGDAPIVAEDMPPELEPVAPPEPPAEEAVETTASEPAKKPRKLPLPVEWAVAGGVAVVAVLLVVLNFATVSTGVYMIAATGIGVAVWRERKTCNVYTILLACALVAMLTAIYCLWSELGRYDFNIRAKQRSSLSSPAHVGSLADAGKLPAAGQPA
jgi:hypothetical protein